MSMQNDKTRPGLMVPAAQERALVISLDDQTIRLSWPQPVPEPSPLPSSSAVQRRAPTPWQAACRGEAG